MAKREQIGGYRLLEMLRSSANGGVFLAESPDSRRSVVLKLVGRGERFDQQLRVYTRLDHPHLVTIVEAGQEHGECFLVMDRLKGETLQARLKREHRLPLKEAMRVGRETASGLGFAHAQGLVHRKICPDNIWLEPSGRVRLLGLGPAQDDDTLLGRLDGRGTPGYLSPEQAAGETTTAASDLFSLGCVLYRMTTGEEPFGGESHSAIRAVVFAHPKPAREINPEIPGPLDELIARLLAKLPSGRPASAQEVEQLLMEWIDPTAPAPLADPRLRVGLTAPIVYPASKRILEALKSARNLPPDGGLPDRSPQAQPVAATAPARGLRRWLPDLIAAALLLAGAIGLYLWWRASNDTPKVPAVLIEQVNPR
jgi:serine/threonine protein kinase